MPLTSAGRVYACPCCGLGIPLAFERKELLTLQPPTSPYTTMRGSDVPTTRLTRKFRVCRQCGYTPDLPPEDENNKWAVTNAARLRSLGPLENLPRAEAPRGRPAPIPAGPPAVNYEDLPQAGVTPTADAPPGAAAEPPATDADAEVLQMSDEPDEDSEATPSAPGKSRSR